MLRGTGSAGFEAEAAVKIPAKTTRLFGIIRKYESEEMGVLLEDWENAGA